MDKIRPELKEALVNLNLQQYTLRFLTGESMTGKTHRAIWDSVQCLN